MAGVKVTQTLSYSQVPDLQAAPRPQAQSLANSATDLPCDLGQCPSSLCASASVCAVCQLSGIGAVSHPRIKQHPRCQLAASRCYHNRHNTAEDPCPGRAKTRIQVSWHLCSEQEIAGLLEGESKT